VEGSEPGKMKNYHIITAFTAITIIALTTFSVCNADPTVDDEFDEEIAKDVDNDALNITERRIPGLPRGMPKWARPFTQRKSGCPCWWNLELGNVCACCKQRGQPCGYPLHNFCQQNKRWGIKKGCPGLIPNGNKRRKVDYERYTLSTSGYPCYYDKSNKNCAWCVPGSQQCGKAKTWQNRVLDKNKRMKFQFKNMNTCLPVLNSDRKGYAKRSWATCIGKPQDCNNANSECDVNAKCLDTGIKKGIRNGKVWSVHRCACNAGYVGNGLTCASEQTGLVTKPGVKVTTKLTTDVWEQYKLDTSVEVANNDDFMDSLDKLLGGGSCGAGCNMDVVTCPA